MRNRMKRYSYTLWLIIITVSLLFFGCSSSEETQQEKEVTIPQAQQEAPETPPAITTEKTDTIEVSEKEVTPGVQEGTQAQQQMQSSGGYAVQIGAFKMADTAEEIAALARNRFQTTVLTYLDNETGLTKILVGSFASKDEARVFRDQLAQQFPDDYKDAWVTEIPKN
ncbi:MAG: SPOR domain-containing protein [Bacteroidetes bacterium]|nr:MAG: SPOR domain-containing protein [Bacteroidota bacterium]